MTAVPTDVTLGHRDGDQAAALLDALCEAYADAYGVQPTQEKTSAFRGRATKQLERPGFDLVTAYAGEQLVGFAFGYALQPDTHWWDGLEAEPTADFAAEGGARSSGLSELEVRQAGEVARWGGPARDVR